MKADDVGFIKTYESSQSNPRGDVRVLNQLALDLDDCNAEVRYLINF